MNKKTKEILAQQYQEYQADFLACCLLMPEQVFRLKWREFEGSFTLLAYYFGVTKGVVGMRAHYLKLEK